MARRVRSRREITVLLPLWDGHGAAPPSKEEIETFYGERRVVHPLWDLPLQTLQDAVAETPLPWLSTRSLECVPCIYASPSEARPSSEATQARLEALEKRLGKAFCMGRLGPS